MTAAPWVHPKTGILWYRKVVPERARHLFDGKREVRRSLGTRNASEARVRHARIAAEVEARIAAAAVAPHGLTYQELVGLAGEWYRRKLAAWAPEPGSARDWGAVADCFRDDLENYARKARRVRQPLVGGAPIDDDEAPAAWAALAPELPDDFRAIMREVDAIASSAGYHLDQDTRDRLYGLTFGSALKLYGRMETLASGDYGDDPHLSTFPPLSRVPADQAAPNAQARSVVSFTDLIAGWAAERRPNDKTRDTVRGRIRLLVAFLGHNNAAEVATDDLRRWRQHLLAEGRQLTTANNYVSNVKIVLSWAAENGRLSTNPAAGLRFGAGKRKAGEGRLPFNDDEARLLLDEARKLKGADRWIPWLLAFTGARVEEVAQAMVGDLREQDGIIYLDINADDGKSLKTAESARRVPLHPALVAEGFLHYVAGLPKDGRLFPDLALGPFDTWSAAYSKRAGHWVRKLGITDRRKVANHSWRHRFKDVCRDAEVPKDQHDALTGHAGRTVGDGYGSGHSLRTLAQAVCRLPLPRGLVIAGYRDG